MSVWSLGDVLDIVKEGIPFAKLETININSSMMPSLSSNPSNASPTLVLKIDLTLELPLDRIRDITVFESANMDSFFHTLAHPDLFKDGNFVYLPSNDFTGMGTCQLFRIEGNKVLMNVVVNLDGDKISATARSIRDSNFYGLLDAALAD